MGSSWLKFVREVNPGPGRFSKSYQGEQWTVRPSGMKVALQTCTWNELIVDGERAQITGRRINPAKCCDESASWQRTVWPSRLDSE
jgi:hypothetical protein